MECNEQSIVFQLNFDSYQYLSEAFECIKKIKETHPDAIIHIEMGV